MQKYLPFIFLLSIINLATWASAQSCLVAQYHFSGNTLDSSTNANHATSNAVTLTTDRFGNANSAYQFNGSSSWIDLGKNYDYAKRSINLWFYLDTIATNYEMIYLSDNPNLTNGLTAFSTEYTNNKMTLRSFGGNVSDIGKIEIKIKTWYMATITVDNVKNEAKHYLNGKLYATTTAGVIKSVDGLNTALLGVTRRKTSPFFKGKIDDVNIYDCVIDSADIKKLYTPKPTNLNVPLEKNAQKAYLIIYPNPTNDILNYQLNADHNTQVKFTLHVMDVMGRVVHMQQISAQGSVNIQNLESGNYMLLVKGNSGLMQAVRFTKSIQ